MENNGLSDLFVPTSINTIPGVQIQETPDPNQYKNGWVSSKKPNVVNLNPNADFNGFPHVLAHELEHVLQFQAENRYGGRKDFPQGLYHDKFESEVQKQYGDPFSFGKVADKVEQRVADPRIYKYLTNTYGLAPVYWGQEHGRHRGVHELWADLSSLEQVLKKDLTKDPYVRNLIFGGDDRLVETYRATSGNRMDRLDAKDLPPMTVSRPPPPTLWDYAKQQGQGALNRLQHIIFGE